MNGSHCAHCALPSPGMRETELPVPAPPPTAASIPVHRGCWVSGPDLKTHTVKKLTVHRVIHSGGAWRDRPAEAGGRPGPRWSPRLSLL